MNDVIFYTQMRNILRHVKDNDLELGIPKSIEHRLVHETSRRLAMSKLKEVRPTKTVSLAAGQKVTSC